MRVGEYFERCLSRITQLFVRSIWERLYEITTVQATTSPFRIFGTDDSLNFYSIVILLAVTAAGVRLLTGNEHQHGWLVFLFTIVGYWRGTQHQQQEQATIMEDPSRAESDVVLLLGLRLGWFVLMNGLTHVGPVLVTIMLALFAGAAWGDYHYSQQVWQVWTQSWTKMLDDAWNKLVGQTPSYRAYY